MKSKILGLLSAFVVAGMVALAPASQATTVNLLGANVGSPPVFDSTAVRGTVDCNSCTGLQSYTPAVFGSTANMFSGPVNSGTQSEIDWVNSVLGTSFTSSLNGQVAGGGGDKTFSSTAEYILIKLGVDPEYTIIRNVLGGLQQYIYAGVGRGAGLSHYVEFGGTPVPVPGALPLLITGLIGLGFLGRGRAKKA